LVELHKYRCNFIMNKIDSIIIHCSATKAGQDIGKKEITQMHLQRGFSTIGYNYVVKLDGTVEVGSPLTGRTVIARDSQVCRTTNIQLVSAMWAVWTRTVRQLTPEHRNRRKR